MCDPASGMAAASLAIGTVQAVSKYGAGQAAAAAGQQDITSQIAYNDQQVLNAETARNLEWNAQSTRQLQESDAAVQAVTDNAIRAKRARATADTSAADSGVEGVSVESVARQVFREQGRLDNATAKNLDMTVAALQDEKVQSEAKRVGRSQFAPIQRAPAPPSLLNLGLDIGGSAVNAYSLYKRGKDEK